MDLALTLAINGWAGRWPMLDAIGIAAAVWLIAVLACAAGAITLRTSGALRRRATVALVATVLIAYGASVAIGALAFRERPFVRHAEIVRLIAKEPTEKSFPSGHATAAFALVLPILTLVSRRWRRVAFLAAAVLVALGRVYVGVHYVSDVVAGALLAWGVAWLVQRLLPAAAVPK